MRILWLTLLIIPLGIIVIPFGIVQCFLYLPQEFPLSNIKYIKDAPLDKAMSILYCIIVMKETPIFFNVSSSMMYIHQ